MPGEVTQTTSFATLHGPWETKEISIYGAARAFIKNMKVGTDLTHVSLPAIFLLPYSILEFLAVRLTATFDLLLPLTREPNPQKRLEGIIRYIVAMGREEDLLLNHKPCNPILGEVHKARIDHEDGSSTYILCEQTVHHPPTSAFEFHNPQNGVTVSGNMNFGATFHTNSVTVGTTGGLKVRLTLPNGSEELYLLEEGVPDMLIKNVIFGTKYVYWTGSLHVNCPSSGFHAQLAFGYEDSQNILNGVIWNENHVPVAQAEANGSKPEKVSWTKWAKNCVKTTAKYTHLISSEHDENSWIQNITPLFELNNVLAKLYGICGQEAHVYPITGPQDPSIPRENRERYLLVDPKLVQFTDTYRYPPQELLEDHCSLKVWHDLGAAIVADDMERADEAKTIVEIAQREARAKRTADGVEHTPVFFELDSGHGWDFWTITNRQWYLNDPCGIYRTVE